MIQKVIAYFARNLPNEDNETISTCLEMVRFGMSHTLVQFQGRYFEVGGNESTWERGLTIGGYESAWFGDVVAAFLLETSHHCFQDAIYHGIYRDGGLLVLKGKLTQQDLEGWLLQFQTHIDRTLESTALQFTADLWLPTGTHNPSQKTKTKRSSPVTITTNKTFPFLDVEFFWSKREVLGTRVYLKPNQHLKYLNSDSEHTNACIKAIPKGVLQRLTKLTSLNADNHDKTINTLYPEHANAL